MTVILILLGAIVGVGALLYVLHRLTSSNTNEEGEAVEKEESDGKETTGKPAGSPEAVGDGECCGLHVVCERDSLLAGITEQAVYYDDEELDRFRGREADAYSEAEADEFRDVMLTMDAGDIAGWARSLKLRGVEMPKDVREELIMIVAERRRENLVATTGSGKR